MPYKSIIAKQVRKFQSPIPQGAKSQHFDDIMFTPTAIDEFCSINDFEYNKVVRLIQDIWENGLCNGMGKPEYITYHNGLKDFYSRRITGGDRLRYKLVRGENRERILLIEGCKWHYKNNRRK